MSDNKNVDDPTKDELEISVKKAVLPSEVSSVAGSVKTAKTHSRVSSSSERQIKFERAQKCLENAALVSKRIKEHRKATAELLGRPFEDDDGGDTASEMASTMSEKTGYSAATDTSTTLSVQEALNIPGISESLANTLKQKELLMERIKQYKEISKRPMKTYTVSKKETVVDSSVEPNKAKDNRDMTQLTSILKEKENALSVMQIKIKAMETTILDLQEKINEKDQIIEAKNKATSLMSDSLSKKEKDSLALLEDTRQQMIKMQENFINMEAEWKEEKNRLLKDIEEKDERISNLEETNAILENAHLEVNAAHSKLVETLEFKNKQISELQEKIQKLSQVDVQELSSKEKQDIEEEKGSIEIANMVELTKKIELLEQLNCQIRQTNKELENKLAAMSTESKSSATNSPSKKASPLPSRKGGRNTASKMKSPWSNLSTETLNQDTEKKNLKSEATKLDILVQSLNKDILDKEYVISQKDCTISELQQSINQKDLAIEKLKLQINTVNSMVDVGVCTDKSEVLLFESDVAKHTAEDVEYTLADVKDLGEKLTAAQHQILALNEEIDAANKNMIKVKSNHKLKLKQMQKTIDNFSKVSDANAEIVKLNEELHQLSQKVAELEEEKGNLQLHLVDYDSGRLTESDVYKKMVEMENLAETRLKAISVLEAQKFDLVQELHEIQQKNVEMEDKLADMTQLQNEQVCTEIKSVQLEEQIDQLTASKKELELITENLKLDKEHLNGTIKVLEEEKEELIHKLENCIQENMELTDKLEKLSAEKVSSAESIEIVESLTTQEKLELEEYNKGMIENKIEDSHTESYKVPSSQEYDEKIEKLMVQSVELTRKIELFTQERQEVMEKMSKINSENKSLHESILDLTDQCNNLQNTIDLLNGEKHELTALNNELCRQIEELKREKIEIIKETVEIAKPSSVDDVVEGATGETHIDDKTSGDKGNNRTKSVKQLTKEILKLKNIIKDREAEIGDCHMKILSLEEQQQKQNEFAQNNASYEAKVKSLMDENHQLKEELETAKRDIEAEQQVQQFKQANEFLQQEIQKLRQEYTVTINSRDSRIHELENLLVEYEKQIFNYANTLQQKDKDMAEYINQITKLNDILQKLKSTIEVLEEEKSKDQNNEIVKSLNKQISVYQKKLTEYEEKLRILEEDKIKLLALKNALENKNVNLESELKKLQDSFAEKQTQIKELQTQQQKHLEEISNVTLQVKDRDEEIHEMKLQLRKESIENEKLRTSLSDKDHTTQESIREFEEIKEKLGIMTTEKEQLREQNEIMETKNKEMMEKLKKFAASIKKKSAMYADLESTFIETQKQLQIKSEHINQLTIQIEALPALLEKLKYAEEELSRLQSQKQILLQQKSQEILDLQTHTKTLEEKLSLTLDELTEIRNTYAQLQKELHLIYEENAKLKGHIELLSNKLADHEIEQKNNTNFVTKISSLETDISQKQSQIVELSRKLENQDQQLNQLQYGHDAKLQERDLYIESLDAEISKYKNRICRLEESISVMENSRHSLERKADQLDNQLQEKQKAYSEYTSQEDQLVNRLAVLMDHDRVVEKQLYEIESENKELQYKIQHFTEESQRLRKSLSDIQEYCNTLVEKASKTDFLESEVAKQQTQVRELETQLKRVTQEHQTIINQRKHDIEELESEFNTQIENAIKEKKTLSEKYEKMNEHVTVLENKLHEYRNNNENLNINLEELTRINQELIERNTSKEQLQSLDYTEQYINEINNLNSVINSKNQEICEINNRIQNLQTNNASMVTNLENKIAILNDTLQQASSRFELLVQESDAIRLNNDQLQLLLSQKEEQIKQLLEKKRVTFEMNIPKTEGMIISSTIEPLNEGQKEFDLSSLESQIVTDTSPAKTQVHISEQKQKQSDIKEGTSEGVVEDKIVPKKAYLCYKGDEIVPEQSNDPFNSDEGWGLGECEEFTDVTPGYSHLNNEIQELKKENTALKTDLEANNNKLLKAMKKLKEFKANNEILINELKISKQLSHSSLLDSAIEDEMKINIQQLEKKIEELIADSNKEKREKEILKKQNDIYHNANDRLTDMKEKLENEIELWKYKFKEVNDKMATMQWNTDSPDHKSLPAASNVKDSVLQQEIIKLENENDELQSVIDQLTSQNKELSLQCSDLKTEIDNLNVQLQQNTSNYEIMNERFIELENINTQSLARKNDLAEKLSLCEIKCNDLLQQCEKVKTEKEEIKYELSVVKNELIKYAKMEQEIQHLKLSETDLKNQISTLLSELEMTKSNLILLEEQHNIEGSQNQDAMIMAEKCRTLENNCLELKQNLDYANNKILQLDIENQDLRKNIKNFEAEIILLNENIKHLSSENNQLLSIVAELRSSVSSVGEQQSIEIDNDNTKMLQLETENLKLLDKIKEYEEEILKLNEKLKHLNTENDQLLSTVAELRSSVSSAIDQRGFEIAELWKQHLAQREADFHKTEQELRSQLSAFEAKYEQLLDNVQSSSQEETNQLVMMEQVTSLQNKLHDKEEHLHNLQDKYGEVINQIDILRAEVEDERLIFENKLLSQQEDYEKQINELTLKTQQTSENYEQAYKNLQSELNETKTHKEALSEQIQKLLDKIKDSEEKIIETTNQLRNKDTEIYQKTHDFTITLAQRNEEFDNVQKQLIEYEKKLEDLSYEKESELAVLRLKMHEKQQHYEKTQTELENEKSRLIEELNAKIIECTNLNKQISELNNTLKEQSTSITEMQTALENQEYEIVTLKDEISNLRDTLRSSSGKLEKHVTFSSDTKPGAEVEVAETTLNKELLDAVPRAELDLALYMLHQRDVRCEELTMELTQLLEERDTLQLRLSDSLRSHEDLKANCKAAGLDISISSTSENVSELPTFTAEKDQQFVDIHKGQTSRSSSVSDPDGQNLQAKLSELRSVKHSRDVRLRQESEQRQMDLRLLQRDVANLPPEAVDQLTQAHHTLSRDSQSTSTVLLNWLRGKSTPKVVHM